MFVGGELVFFFLFLLHLALAGYVIYRLIHGNLFLPARVRMSSYRIVWLFRIFGR